MSQKFYQGDMVKVFRLDGETTSKEMIGFIGTIREVDPLPNGEYNYEVDGHYMHEGELEKYQNTKKVKLKDHPFFLELTQSSMMYDGESADKELTIAVSTGFANDWAAYFETPYSHGRVAEHGAKLPEDVARFFFPDVAGNRKYRN